MKSLRVIHTLIEALSLVATVIFVALLFHLLQSHIKTELIKSQTADIDKIDLSIEEYVNSTVVHFDNFLRLSQQGDVSFLFRDFSDIYRIDRNLRVVQLFKRDASSRIFTGYDLSGSRLAALVASIADNKTHFSPAFRTAETEKLSFYMARAADGGYLVGRVGLEQITGNLSRLADYSQGIILIATRDGFVLSSTRADLPLNVLPEGSQAEMRLPEGDYLVTRRASRVFDNDIVILTPLSTVYLILRSLSAYSAVFILFMIAIAALRLFIQSRLLFGPLKAFSTLVQTWDVDRDHPPVPVRFLAYREIYRLYQSFRERIEKIRDLFVELRQREQVIDKMRIYLKSIIDSMPSVLIAVDEQGGIHEWNQAAVRFTGLNASEVLGKKVWDVLPALKKYELDCLDALAHGRPKHHHRKILGREMIQDGTERYMDISVFPLFFNGAEEVAIRLDDVTEQERTEQQLRQAQKMETIGILVGGVAHDFNNVLSGIVGTLSLMKQHLQMSQAIPPQKLADYIQTMERAGARASDMIKQMLVLARRQELSLAPVELNGLIRQVAAICTNTFDKRIELDVRYHPGDAMVTADAVQIEQVLLNLAINAMHAMTIMRPDGKPHGGRLLISLSPLFADPFFCEGHREAKQGIRYWLISVQDTGEGMDVKTVAKIFDPFFSTKEKGQGTGLGLSIVYNIVREHRGFVDVYSEPGKGSTFNVFLPLLENVSAVAQVAADITLPRGEGCLLIIDDEEAVRSVAAEMLELCGYRVIAAENGLQGIDLYQRHRQEIQLVLLDINMPLLSGAETMVRLKEIDPEVKVVVTSGFIQDEKADVLMRLGAVGFVQKPFTLSLLAKSVSAALPKKGFPP
jgi:PAS domain S-box-containing protein